MEIQMTNVLRELYLNTLKIHVNSQLSKKAIAKENTRRAQEGEQQSSSGLSSSGRHRFNESLISSIGGPIKNRR